MSDSANANRPTAAGMYDFYLGGTAHTPIDRTYAEQITKILPEVTDGVWANRGFLQRAVRRMARDWGIRQFIDIGAGLPTQRNTHDVVDEEVPDGRVIYVDHDPQVVAQGHAMVADHHRTAFIQGDVREPGQILNDPRTQQLIDFREPVGLLLVAVVHFVPDDDDPWALVARYVAALPRGSYVALTHASGDHLSPDRRDAALRIYQSTPHPPQDRTKTEIERFFTGLDIVPPYPGAEPTVTFAGLWDAEDVEAADSEGARWFFVGVGRKP